MHIYKQQTKDFPRVTCEKLWSKQKASFLY